MSKRNIEREVSPVGPFVTVGIINGFYRHHHLSTVEWEIGMIASLFRGGLSALASAKDELETGRKIVDIVRAADSNTILLWNMARGEGSSQEVPEHHEFGLVEFRKKTSERVIGVGTIDGFTLSAAKDSGILSSVSVLTLWKAAETMRESGFITPEEKKTVCLDRGRSLHFPLLAAAYIWGGCELPSWNLPLARIPDPPGQRR